MWAVVEFLPEKLFELWGFPVTNTLLTTYLAMGVLIGVALLARVTLKTIPGHFQSVVELMSEGAGGFVRNTFGSAKLAEQIMPVVATFFLYILAANWLGLVPGIGTIGFNEVAQGHTKLVPILRPANTDINMTLGLAIVSVFLAQYFGIKKLGLLKYGAKFFRFKSPIDFFVGILELISEFAKLISFSFRLFGNMFAGEVMLIVAAIFLPYLLPLPFMALEVFVGLIQAAVFAMLTMIFLKTAVEENH